jgi:glycopeptide antibiotics resistance protein
MLVVYTLFVFWVTLTPRMPGSGLLSRIVDRFLLELRDRGITNIHFLDIEFFGNILMFVPLGILAAMLVPRRAWWTLLLLGTAFSGVIEASQAAFLPDRLPDARDLFSNTTGFLIGAAASVALRLLVAHRDGLVDQDRRREGSLAGR